MSSFEYVTFKDKFQLPWLQWLLYSRIRQLKLIFDAEKTQLYIASEVSHLILKGKHLLQMHSIALKQQGVIVKKNSGKN